MKSKVLYVIIIILALFAILNLTVNVILFKKINASKESPDVLASTMNSLIKPVSAAEIYPLFFCPCCGQPLDPNNICCGAAKERIDYIDNLVKTYTSEKEVILAYVKRYGVNSFVDPNKAKEIKEELVRTAPADRPIISLVPESYDFGNVSQKQGVVTTWFNLTNSGTSDLIIDKIETSCGCTSASIVYQGKEGPKFAMPGHGVNENISGWQVNIAPGDTAQLKVYYDPNVHQDFRGAAIREIYVFSNDPINFEKKVKIELEQVD